MAGTLRDAVPSLFRELAVRAIQAIVGVTILAFWTTYLDVRDLKDWRTQKHPLEEAVQAAQLQNQIMRNDERARMTEIEVEMLRADMVMLQIQLARITPP